MPVRSPSRVNPDGSSYDEEHEDRVCYIQRCSYSESTQSQCSGLLKTFVMIQNMRFYFFQTEDSSL